MLQNEEATVPRAGYLLGSLENLVHSKWLYLDLP